mmetsp:Transcript_5552/g.6387  ORF Transcript_5552/g.6387 Transcript_5552/m.6387 type:complete len:168 (+) Transcript_5552:211-714(+)|eukprot:CAMPEP_0197850786 /NCGR_PEP_ID=MMETSP1438-20131217/16384_1 /TAXON_ID=1461541 /ORGANISM="Pterosperma sp., Strain CCMP1384" /LENGTH=167 /DNA_ID=CAMNT_0043464141 /DNA_START=192 /DNA_END=695 /DNA_ORIENTATION=+
MKSFVFAATLLLMIGVAQAGYQSQLIDLRGKYLALEMIENRCPLQKGNFIREYGARAFGNFAKTSLNVDLINRRHLLDETEETTLGEALETPLEASTGRALLGGKPVRTEDINKDVWRNKACDEALNLVDQFCRGAPDDLGPGVLMPWIEALECIHKMDNPHYHPGK